MPIAINGSGTITGISAGGLPDSVITTDDIAVNAVTTAKLGSAEASGLAKAWVNFNGTGVVAIRASFNVSSITDNGTGDYTVNFTTALADANYSVCGMNSGSSSNADWAILNAGNGGTDPTSSAVRIRGTAAAAPIDTVYCNVAIFR